MRAVIADWYGMPASQMPMRIQTREEEIEAFEADHPEVPACLWEYVNHPVRQTLLWAKRPDVDILVWDERTMTAKLVQDICFKDAYPDDVAWRNAVRDLVGDKDRKVWIVFHC
jgi:hypothetical protein